MIMIIQFRYLKIYSLLISDIS